jgi:serine protease Do
VDESAGSGCLVVPKEKWLKGKWLVVTNRHVIEHASRGIEVHFLKGQDKGGGEKRLIGADQTSVLAVHRTADLAIVDVTRAKAQLLRWKIQPAPLAGPAIVPQPGTRVFAIGHPGYGIGGALDRTLSPGIVSGPVREFQKARYIQTTAPLNPGNSGGPLFDMAGRVVGVCTYILRKRAGGDGVLEALNFALEVAYVHELLGDSGKSLDSREIADLLRPRWHWWWGGEAEPAGKEKKGGR